MEHTSLHHSVEGTWASRQRYIVSSPHFSRGDLPLLWSKLRRTCAIYELGVTDVVAFPSDLERLGYSLSAFDKIVEVPVCFCCCSSMRSLSTAVWILLCDFVVLDEMVRGRGFILLIVWVWLTNDRLGHHWFASIHCCFLEICTYNDFSISTNTAILILVDRSSI